MASDGNESGSPVRPLLAGSGSPGWPHRLRASLLRTADHDPTAWRIGSASPGSNNWPVALQPARLRPAAVLIPLIERASGPTVLLTVRSPGLRQHAGQISFPGGRMESVDADPMSAALREAEEEIGLGAEAVELLGYLLDHVVLTGFRITPVVGWIRELPPLRLDREEVAEVFELPVRHLLDDGNYRMRRRELRGQQVEVRELVYGPFRVWGATASMLQSLRPLLARSL